MRTCTFAPRCVHNYTSIYNYLHVASDDSVLADAGVSVLTDVDDAALSEYFLTGSYLGKSCNHFSNPISIELGLDDDLGDVVDAVEPLASKWRILTTKLRLKQSTLDVIERNNPGDVVSCLHKAMGEWLRLNYDHQRHGRPSWRRLAEAVSSLDYGLSEMISTMYIQSK